MKIKAYSTNKLQTNCYLIENENKCIIVDPCVKYDDIFKNTEYNLEAVIITHAHFDHIDQLNTYLEKGIEFYMHENAYEKLKDPKLNLSKNTGFPFSYDLDAEKVLFVTDGDKLELIGKKVEFKYYPGHSDCSIALLIDEHMFSGDMLFRGSIGRYDLPTSNYTDIMDSIYKLKQLQNKYYVYPGHGPKTTIEFEIKNNPYFR